MSKIAPVDRARAPRAPQAVKAQAGLADLAAFAAALVQAPRQAGQKPGSGRGGKVRADASKGVAQRGAGARNTAPKGAAGLARPALGPMPKSIGAAASRRPAPKTAAAWARQALAALPPAGAPRAPLLPGALRPAPKDAAGFARHALAALPKAGADPRPRMEAPPKPPTLLQRAERATQHVENFGFGAVASFPKGAVATVAELAKGGNALGTLMDANVRSAPAGGLVGGIGASIAADMLRGASALPLPLPKEVRSGLNGAAGQLRRVAGVDEAQKAFDRGEARRAGIDAWAANANRAIDGYLHGQGAEMGGSYHAGTAAMGLYGMVTGLRRSRVPLDPRTATIDVKAVHVPDAAVPSPAGSLVRPPAAMPVAVAPAKVPPGTLAVRQPGLVPQAGSGLRTPPAAPPGEPRHLGMLDELKAMLAQTHGMAPRFTPGAPNVLAMQGGEPPPPPPLGPLADASAGNPRYPWQVDTWPDGGSVRAAAPGQESSKLSRAWDIFQGRNEANLTPEGWYRHQLKDWASTGEQAKWEAARNGQSIGDFALHRYPDAEHLVGRPPARPLGDTDTIPHTVEADWERRAVVWKNNAIAALGQQFRDAPLLHTDGRPLIHWNPAERKLHIDSNALLFSQDPRVRVLREVISTNFGPGLQPQNIQLNISDYWPTGITPEHPRQALLGGSVINDWTPFPFEMRVYERNPRQFAKNRNWSTLVMTMMGADQKPDIGGAPSPENINIKFPIGDVLRLLSESSAPSPYPWAIGRRNSILQMSGSGVRAAETGEATRDGLPKYDLTFVPIKAIKEDWIRNGQYNPSDVEWREAAFDAIQAKAARVQNERALENQSRAIRLSQGALLVSAGVGLGALGANIWNGLNSDRNAKTSIATSEKGIETGDRNARLGREQVSQFQTLPTETSNKLSPFVTVENALLTEYREATRFASQIISKAQLSKDPDSAEVKAAQALADTAGGIAAKIAANQAEQRKIIDSYKAQVVSEGKTEPPVVQSRLNDIRSRENSITAELLTINGQVNGAVNNALGAKNADLSQKQANLARQVALFNQDRSQYGTFRGQALSIVGTAHSNVNSLEAQLNNNRNALTVRLAERDRAVWSVYTRGREGWNTTVRARYPFGEANTSLETGRDRFFLPIDLDTSGSAIGRAARERAVDAEIARLRGLQDEEYRSFDTIIGLSEKAVADSERALQDARTALQQARETFDRLPLVAPAPGPTPTGTRTVQ